MYVYLVNHGWIPRGIVIVRSSVTSITSDRLHHSAHSDHSNHSDHRRRVEAATSKLASGHGRTSNVRMKRVFFLPVHTFSIHSPFVGRARVSRDQLVSPPLHTSPLGMVEWISTPAPRQFLCVKPTFVTHFSRFQRQKIRHFPSKENPNAASPPGTEPVFFRSTTGLFDGVTFADCFFTFPNSWTFLFPTFPRKTNC